MKSVITIIIVVAVGFLGYWYYATPKPATNELLVGSAVSGNTNADTILVGKKIISLLSEMQRIHIDQSIFGATAFQSLEDFGVEIKPELVGRHDPFAPIGFESGASFEATSSARGGR